MPASASPSCTLVDHRLHVLLLRHDVREHLAVEVRAEAGRLRQLGEHLRGCSAPTGTASAPITIFTPRRARSWSLPIRAGLVARHDRRPAGCARTAAAGSASSRRSSTYVIHRSSAEANTSACAPCSSCAASCCEPAKLSCTRVPGWARSKAAAISSKASPSDAAAKTRSVLLARFGRRRRRAAAPPRSRSGRRPRGARLAAADLDENRLLVTHGNGPVVGKILLRMMLRAMRFRRCASTCASRTARAASATC